jgi:hypothetical protein
MEYLMHKISRTRSIKSILRIKLKTNSYEQWSKSSINTDRLGVLGRDNCELLSKYPFGHLDVGDVAKEGMEFTGSGRLTVSDSQPSVYVIQ